MTIGKVGCVAKLASLSSRSTSATAEDVASLAAATPDAEATASPLLSFAGQTGRAKTVDLARGFWSDAPRVLPLGDSNTLGFSNVLPLERYEGYRRELWSLAVEDRFWFDYVGGRANGPASLLDRNHQGVGGIRATTVVDQAGDLASTHRPDIVLLMLGTNDALNEANAASTVRGELLSIMRSIDAVQPDATILLAPLPPIDPTVPGYRKRADADEIRAAINAQLPDLAQAAQAEDIDARFVSMPGLAKSDLFDGVHPTAAGHAKIAAAFYRALEEGLASGEFGGSRTATAGVRDLTGSELGDFLSGDAAANRISGRSGSDRIEGRAGADVLTGGAAADVFFFRASASAGDRITDFSSADFIEVSAAGFGGGLVSEGVVILRSGGAPAPRGGAGQFLYDSDDGRLFWDVDGSGSAPRERIATLTGAPAINADDFLIL